MKIQLTSDERAELAQLRRESRELRREKDFFQAGGRSIHPNQKGFRLR
jgi:hypothetical protein